MIYPEVDFDKTSLEKCSQQLWSILEPEIDYLNEDDKKVVELAFTEMVMAHGEIRRKSGDFYIIHPVMATITLARIRLDRDTIAACLLHDVPEDTEVTLKDLSKEFSPEIVFLVEGVTKFSTLKYQGQERYVENLRKMFVSMSKDIRIVFIKLADRLHNLSTLEHVREDKRHRIALESIEVYAPIAERLGMSKLRSWMEEAAFPYAYPQEYEILMKNESLNVKKREEDVNYLIQKTKNILDEAKIEYNQVVGRSKQLYSIYKKMRSKNKKIENMYDLVALRIITNGIDNCYNILSLIHEKFEPIDGRIKDYVNMPKANGYKSIHTTVRDIETGIVFEFQIRTNRMHQFAEYGIATHWAYKEGSDKKEVNKIKPRNFQWISELIELGEQKLTQEDYLKKVKLNLYKDRIFILTPTGDVLDLVAGATCLDFAFKIHNDVGKTAIMAKINGNKAKLSDKLQNGDMVEITTNKKQTPTYQWLEWVKSKMARSEIKAYLRKLRQQESDDSNTK